MVSSASSVGQVKSKHKINYSMYQCIIIMSEYFIYKEGPFYYDYPFIMSNLTEGEYSFIMGSLLLCVTSFIVGPP